jgi:hypothetical protein
VVEEPTLSMGFVVCCAKAGAKPTAIESTPTPMMEANFFIMFSSKAKLKKQSVSFCSFLVRKSIAANC